jgi:hypothetical protein
MSHAHSSGRLVAAAVAVMACAAPVSASESLQVGYSVSLLGLPMGTAALSAQVSRSNYSVEVNARLSGVATMVSRARGAAKSSGIISQGRVLPKAFSTATSNSRETRTVRMALNAGSVRAVDIAPPIDDHPARVPVTSAHKRGIVDPVSALVMPAPSHGPLVSPAACDRTIAVYDGYARFDVRLSYAGMREVRSTGYNGLVAVCSARYRAVAGHRTDRSSTQYMENNRQMEVWLMPVERARVLTPFRISVATQIGTVVIEATNVSLASADDTPTAATRSASR